MERGLEIGGVCSMSDWDQKLSEWTSAGLVSTEQAVAIRSREAEAAAQPAEVAGEGRVSPAIEAVGYLGGALAVAAVFFILVVGTDLDEGAQVALAGLLSAVLLGGGAAVRRDTPPARRLKSVLWAAAVASAAATGALVAGQLVDGSGEAIALTSSGIAVLMAAVLWGLHRAALQNIVFLVAAAGAALSLLSWLGGDLDAFFYGLTMWAIGVVWVLLSLVGILTPTRAGLVAGSVSALVGAQIAAFDAYRGWGLALAVVTVTLVLVGGARLNNLGLLVVGAMGALVFSVQVAFELFGTELAAAVALLVAGTLLVVGAVAASRRRSREAST